MKGNRMLVLAYLQKWVNEGHFPAAKINFPESHFWYLPHRPSLKSVLRIQEYCTKKNIHCLTLFFQEKKTKQTTILLTRTSYLQWI